MKTIEHMNMSQMINFDRDVVNYINDNLKYIKADENADATALATAALNHYNATVEAFFGEDEYLSDEQKERFLNVGTRLFSNGYVEHGGILND